MSAIRRVAVALLPPKVAEKFTSYHPGIRHVHTSAAKVKHLVSSPVSLLKPKIWVMALFGRLVVATDLKVSTPADGTLSTRVTRYRSTNTLAAVAVVPE